MKIYQSSLSYKSFDSIRVCRPDIKINLLRSFDLNDNETFRILDEFKDNINSKILDSGVWSKYNDPKNHNHTVKDYMLFLKQYANKFDYYFNYDEDFKEIKRDNFSSKNKDNQKYLEDNGFHPIPVLHALDDDEVDYYLSRKDKYPYVAIGSNAISNKRFAPVVKAFYDASVKVHAFKIGSYKRLINLHAFSSDCSSHAQWTSVGRCIFFDHEAELEVLATPGLKKQIENTIAFNKTQKNGKRNKYYFEWNNLKKVFLNYLSRLPKVEFTDLIQNSNVRTYSNSIYYWWLERYISMLHYDKGIDFNDDTFIDENLNCFECALNFGEKSILDEFIDNILG